MKNLLTGMTWEKIVENKCVAGMCFWKLNAHLYCFFLKKFLNPNTGFWAIWMLILFIVCWCQEVLETSLPWRLVTTILGRTSPRVLYNTTNWYLLLYRHSVFRTTACSSNLFLAAGAAFLQKVNNPSDAIKFPFCLLCTC